MYGVPVIGVKSQMSLIRPQSEHVRTRDSPAAYTCSLEIWRHTRHISRQRSWLRRLQCAAPPVAHDAPASDLPVEDVLAATRSPQRQPFVGRESELRQLQSAFESAANCDGALNMLVGEPGIGQSSLRMPRWR
jgi:hypothetical protein